MNRDTPEEKLFCYLRDILYAPQNAQLCPEEMPERLQRLAEGLLIVGDYIRENKQFVTSLANGDLSCHLPSVENTIAAPAKALHASLAHLTWQTKRVAQGDLQQQVDFMGEFAEAFNYMIRQLRRAKELEARELALAQTRVVELSQAKELFTEMAENNRQLIIVTDSQCTELFYTNHDPGEQELAATMAWLKLGPFTADNMPLRWEYVRDAQTQCARYYSISSHITVWNGKSAVAHMIADVTELTKKEREMQQLAYVDALTGAFNRRYGMDYMEKLEQAGKRFTVALCDLDDLKYCNDAFGHEEGDRYIVSACAALSDLAGNRVLCRTGGDEFLVISEDTDEAGLEEAMEAAQCRLARKPLPQGYILKRNISFGVAVCSGELSLSAALALADERMYAQKRTHKLYGRNKAENEA